MNFIKRQSPGLVITSGFAIVIFIGALLLLLPCSVKDGATVTFVDALFTSTSAVCVTGLIAIDTADHFTAIGQAVVALLIQIGGLGVTSVGVGVMIAVGHRVSYRSRTLIKEALNVDTYSGIVKFVKAILLTTLFFESLGAILSFIVFSQDYPTLHALESVYSIPLRRLTIRDLIFWAVEKSDPVSGECPAESDHLRIDFLWRYRFPCHYGYSEAEKIQEAYVSFKSCTDNKYCPDYCRDSPAKADRAHYMAWRVVSQCFGENSRFFNISDRKLQHSRTLCPLCSDVYRCFSGINRRRYQDEYILYPCTGSPEYVFKTCGWRI